MMQTSSVSVEHRLSSPGAGPSRRGGHSSVQDEDDDRESFWKSKKDYIELEQAVQSSSDLLGSLSSYLSTFQNDLSAVSGQITDLQQRSSQIETQLQGRRTILPSLNALLSDISLPPALVLTIRDTRPSQNPELWLSSVQQLEEKMKSIQARRKVKASHEMDTVIEGLLTKVLTHLPPFLMSLIKPLRSSSTGLSTNLAVLQTSLLLKYQPFYAFLLRQDPRLAKQVERGYVNASRSYYETGMRRYARALGQIKARTAEKSDLIGVVSGEAVSNGAYDRLKYAGLDVEGEAGSVVLAYMADDSSFRIPVEALFRSLSLVLIDNASAELTFLVRFFARSASTLETPDSPSEAADTERARQLQLSESLKDAERIWHEVFDPALEYCSTFFNSILAPSPPSAVVLLTLIRLNDQLLATCDSRGTLPMIPFLQAQKLTMWPIYRKEMDQHIDSLKRLANEAEGKGLAGFVGKGVKDGAVRQVASRYAALFSCVTALSEEAEEAMIFSSMTRMRAELVRLAQTQSNKIKSVPERHSFLSSIYEIIMHELVAGPGATTHSKLQSELSFFRTREEEARRRITV